MDTFIIPFIVFVNGILIGLVALYALLIRSMARKVQEKKDALTDQLENTIKILEKAHQDVSKAMGILDTKVSEVSLKVDSMRGKSMPLKGPFSAL